MKSPATAFLAGIMIIMMTTVTRCGSKSRSTRNVGGGRPFLSAGLTRRRESALMVDIVHGPVAIRFVSGYDTMCLA